MITSRLRGYPDFIIIGAQKCGTTSLYHFVIRHPDIIPARVKEIHYFTVHYKLGSQYYRSNFPTNISRHGYLKKQKKLTGEASPTYIYYSTTPNRMKKIMPNVRLIVILRNPVDRAYSQYHYIIKQRNEKLPLPFEEALELSKERYMKKKEYDDIINNTNSFFAQYNSDALTARGIYADQLENWFKHYDKKQFLFLSTEDFHKNTQHTLDQVFNFLGLNPFKIDNPKRHNVGNYKEKMNEETRKSLIEYFKPHNARLYKLLQRDFGWDK